MAQESTIPQKLMTAALLHFEQGVPIDDCDIRAENKDRLARVSHVYWVWKKNPLLDPFGLLKQLTKQGGYADIRCAWKAAAKDKQLFDFVVETLDTNSRKMDEEIVRAAAKQAIRIGMETDNPNALTKGGKLLYEVDNMDKPEQDKTDASKVMFLPPVVTTAVSDVDPGKQDISDEQALAIINKYNAHQDSKRLAIEERVSQMMAKREGREAAEEDETTIEDE